MRKSAWIGFAVVALSAGSASAVDVKAPSLQPLVGLIQAPIMLKMYLQSELSGHSSLPRHPDPAMVLGSLSRNAAASEPSAIGADYGEASRFALGLLAHPEIVAANRGILAAALSEQTVHTLETTGLALRQNPGLQAELQRIRREIDLSTAEGIASLRDRLEKVYSNRGLHPAVEDTADAVLGGDGRREPLVALKHSNNNAIAKELAANLVKKLSSAIDAADPKPSKVAGWVRELAGPDWSATVSPNRRSIAVVRQLRVTEMKKSGYGAVLHVFDAKTDREIFRKEVKPQSLVMAFSPDGTELVIGETPRDPLYALQLHDGQVLQLKQTPVINAQDSVYWNTILKYSPDGKQIILAYYGALRALDPASGKLEWGFNVGLPNWPANIDSLAFSPDQKLLALGTAKDHPNDPRFGGGGDGDVYVLDRAGRLVFEKGAGQEVHSIGFNAAGDELLIDGHGLYGGGPKSIKLPLLRTP